MDIRELLLNKSKEAFMMAIEVYNKPTIHYRLEGFSFFICNAWELMLKAHIINKNGQNAIYYPDKPNRTLSLEKCIQLVFTNEKSPIRQNLAKIAELRNTSTHYITEEYEMVYVPLLQACVFNFVEKIKEFHNIDMTEIIPENFINLSVKVVSLNEETIRAKYPYQISEQLINTHKSLSTLSDEYNDGFSVRLVHLYYQTRDKNKATEFYHIDNTADEGVRIIKELKDPNKTHNYSAKKCIEEVKKQLERNSLVLYFKGETKEFNKYFFQKFVTYYDLKGNEKYCYVYQVHDKPSYSYSRQAIDFIVNEIKKDPDHILDNINKKADPRSKGF